MLLGLLLCSAIQQRWCLRRFAPRCTKQGYSLCVQECSSGSRNTDLRGAKNKQRSRRQCLGSGRILPRRALNKREKESLMELPRNLIQHCKNTVKDGLYEVHSKGAPVCLNLIFHVPPHSQYRLYRFACSPHSQNPLDIHNISHAQLCTSRTSLVWGITNTRTHTCVHYVCLYIYINK